MLSVLAMKPNVLFVRLVSSLFTTCGLVARTTYIRYIYPKFSDSLEILNFKC